MSTATLAPIAIGDLTVRSFPIERMPCASCMFAEHWALKDLFWAFSCNVMAISLAALGLLSPVVAGAAMTFSRVDMAANALMSRRWKGDRP